MRTLFLNYRFESLFYKCIHSKPSFKDVKPPILGSLVISFTGPDEYGTRYGFIAKVIGLDRQGFTLLPLGVLNKKVNYVFPGSLYRAKDKVYPILVTEDLVTQLGFVPYNIRGFSGYRIKIGGIYLKIKLNENPVAGFILKWGNNTYSGIYLHQLMEILNLYFVI